MENILESYSDFLNESRSETSKIAKRANSTQGTVIEVEKALSNLSSKDISYAVMNHLKENGKELSALEIEKILIQMRKIYGGNISIQISE